MRPHTPKYIYCDDSDPIACCGHFHPIAVVCSVDREDWPCSTKRSHHTETHSARIERWATRRRGRPAEVTA